MNTASKKILIVEDEDSVVYALNEKLGAIGQLKVLCAKNGREGLKLALAEKPDLILLDIILPEIDGLKMLRALRADVWGKNAQVIVLSNLSDPFKEKEASELGVNRYMIKVDWKIDDVIKIVLDSLKN